MVTSIFISFKNERPSEARLEEFGNLLGSEKCLCGEYKMKCVRRTENTMSLYQVCVFCDDE